MSDVLSSMKSRLESAARPFGEAGRQLATLLAEAEPFVECARVAAAEGPLERSSSWREARSMAWLLAYRLGDQEWPAHVAAAVIPAWRDAIGAPWAAAAADELVALFLDGYARGREDRVRSAAQKGLAEALPIGELAPQVVIMVAAGALDPDGARAFADRASSFMLRRDARAALLDVEGLQAPTAAVLVELWSIPSAARMLGVKMVVAGLSGVVGEAVRTSGVKEEGEVRCTTLAQGTEALLREAGIALGSRGGFGAWFRRVFSPRSAGGR
jgi:hypothetical protein